MFKAYRFIKCGGKYFPPDPIETAADAYDYVQTYKDKYPEIRITTYHEDYIAVQERSGFLTESNVDYTATTAQYYLTSLYEGIDSKE